jgi:saccharopine dehydrogenase-like NADP-dependent oxidoreductase
MTGSMLGHDDKLLTLYAVEVEQLDALKFATLVDVVVAYQLVVHLGLGDVLTTVAAAADDLLGVVHRSSLSFF